MSKENRKTSPAGLPYGDCKGHLRFRAQSIVSETMANLPDDLRARASSIPISYADRPSRVQLEEGLLPEDLGLFSGPSLCDIDGPECLESPSITLFLANLWDYCEADPDVFDEEVERTFLHELGHYFGFEEEDMPERDLD